SRSGNTPALRIRDFNSECCTIDNWLLLWIMVLYSLETLRTLATGHLKQPANELFASEFASAPPHLAIHRFQSVLTRELQEHKHRPLLAGNRCLQLWSVGNHWLKNRMNPGFVFRSSS